MTAHDEEPTPGNPVTAEAAAELARLAVLAGARVDALETIGEDLRHLNRSVDALAAVIGSLATKEEVEETAADLDRKRRRTSLLILSGVGAAFVLLAVPTVLSLMLLSEVRLSQQESVRARRLLVECSTPSPGIDFAEDAEDSIHECFEASQDRTANAIADLSLATLDAAICARVAETAEDIPACYADRVQARGEADSP